MSFNKYLIEAFGKKPIQSLEVHELLELLERYKEEHYDIIKQFSQARASLSMGKETEKPVTPEKVYRAIEATKQLENLKGIPLLIKFIDITKENGIFEDSSVFLTLMKRYGDDILDVYIRHDPEAPAFIRKGIDF